MRWIYETAPEREKAVSDQPRLHKASRCLQAQRSLPHTCDSQFKNTCSCFYCLRLAYLQAGKTMAQQQSPHHTTHAAAIWAPENAGLDLKVHGAPFIVKWVIAHSDFSVSRRLAWWGTFWAIHYKAVSSSCSPHVGTILLPASLRSMPTQNGWPGLSLWVSGNVGSSPSHASGEA